MNAPHFVPHVEDAPGRTDLTEDRDSAAIAFFLANRFWQIDTERVVFSGFVTESPNSIRSGLHVSLCQMDGDVYQSANIDAPFRCQLTIRTKEGDIRQAIGRDLVRETKELWLSMSGYPADFPTGTEVEIHGNTIELTIDPLV